MLSVYNILIDGLPDNYKGYKIRTSYKIGVMLSLLLEDEDVDEDYKYVQAIDLLYIDKPEDTSEALEGVAWFISCGENEVYYLESHFGSSNGNKALDFQYDASAIFGTLRLYGVNLSDNLHWFEFISIIHSLPECPLSQRISYRVMDLTKFKGQTRAMYADIQNKVKVRKGYTKEEYEEAMDNMRSNYGSYYEQLRRLNS